MAMRFLTSFVVAPALLIAACGGEADDSNSPTPDAGDIAGQVELTPNVERLRIAVGEPGTVTVALERSSDAPANLTITATDLPAGVTASVVDVAAGEESAAVVLTAAADAEAVVAGTFTVVAIAGGNIVLGNVSIELFVSGAPGTLSTTAHHFVHTGQNEGDIAESCAIDNQGRVLVFGTIGEPGLFVVGRFSARILADGSLDSGFASAGVDLTTFGTGALAVRHQTVLADGSLIGIVLADSLRRLDVSGQPDADFGGAGEVLVRAKHLTPRFGGFLYLEEIVGTRDANYMAMTIDGTLDASFVGGLWTDGISATTNDSGQVLMVSAPFMAPLTLTRLDATGVIDTTFADNGNLELPQGFGGVHMANDGSVSGKIQLQDSWSVFSYDASGAPRANFGVNGSLDLSAYPVGRGFEALPDGGFLVLSGQQILRITADGSVDTSFGTDGLAGSTDGFSIGVAYDPIGHRAVRCRGTTTMEGGGPLDPDVGITVEWYWL